MAYVRTVKTASGAIAVQIVYACRRGSQIIDHLGSAHDDGELGALRSAAGQWLQAGQGELDLGLASGLRPGQHTLTAADPLPSHLRNALALLARRFIRSTCLVRHDRLPLEPTIPAGPALKLVGRRIAKLTAPLTGDW